MCVFVYVNLDAEPRVHLQLIYRNVYAIESVVYDQSNSNLIVFAGFVFT